MKGRFSKSLVDQINYKFGVHLQVTLRLWKYNQNYNVQYPISKEEKNYLNAKKTNKSNDKKKLAPSLIKINKC